MSISILLMSYFIYHFRDLARNEISHLKVTEDGTGPFESLSKLHDLLLSHNNITTIEQHTFKGLQSLQIL